MGRWGPSLLIFILVRKYWQNNYKRRFHTRQASVFHELFVKDDLSRPLLLHWLGELHKGPRWMTRSERRRLQKWRDDGGRALLETISNWRRRWTRRLEEDFAKALKRQRLLWCNPGLWSLKMVSPKNNYKRRYHTGQASVFHRLFVKDDLSKHALAFTWWAPHGPKLDDKKGEEDNDTVDNIGRRRVRFLNE